MKKALLGAAALGLLSSVAVAEPLKLDDGTLGDVAGGISVSSTTMTNEVYTYTSTMNTMDTRTNDLTASALNDVDATAVLSDNVSAMGMANSAINFRF